MPVISTDVGIAKEALDEKYILKERTKEALKVKIIELIENKEELKEMSKNNIKNVQKWSWKNVAKDYKQFFNQNLQNIDMG